METTVIKTPAHCLTCEDIPIVDTRIEQLQKQIKANIEAGKFIGLLAKELDQLQAIRFHLLTGSGELDTTKHLAIGRIW